MKAIIPVSNNAAKMLPTTAPMTLPVLLAGLALIDCGVMNEFVDVTSGPVGVVLATMATPNA